MQRDGERKIRALKREAVAYDTAAKNAPNSATELEMKNAFQATSVKLKDAEKQLKDFCEATGQDRDRFREQVLGFGRSESQKAAHAAKKSQKALTSGADGGIMKLNRELERRDKNTGAFAALKIPMQKKHVLNLCEKYNINTKGITFNYI